MRSLLDTDSFGRGTKLTKEIEFGVSMDKIREFEPVKDLQSWNSC